MQPHSTEIKTVPLGEFLRETRIKQGLDLEMIAEGTKISPKNLQAIEESDFSSLPAEVFARGFYTLYARQLALDPSEILEMYGQERKVYPKENHYKTPPPNRLAEDMKSLAEPPSSLPFAYFGFIFLLLLLFGAFLCWYFAWNPASYLSSKLRSLDPAHKVEQTTRQSAETNAPLSLFVAAQTRIAPHAQTNILSLSSPALASTEATTSQPEERSDALTSPGTTKYHVNAVFQEETKVSLTIDNNPERTMLFKGGEQVSWRAMDKLIITLPGNTKTRISLNQTPLELPKPSKENIILAIPEILLR